MIRVKKFSYQLEPEQEKEVHRQINQYLKAKKSKEGKTEIETSSEKSSGDKRLSEVFNINRNLEFERSSKNDNDSNPEISMYPRSKTAVINISRQEEVKSKF